MNVLEYEEIYDDLREDVSVFEGKTVLITGASGFLGVWFSGFFDFLNENNLKIMQELSA